MKLFFSILILLSSGAQAQSLYDQRDQAAEAANKTYYEGIYAQRSAELIAKLQSTFGRLAAKHGGITNFQFNCTPGNCVSGSTFLGYGSFDTADGALGCKIHGVALDLVYCHGPAMTQCPEMRMGAECLDASGNRSYLSNNASSGGGRRRSHR